MLNEAQLTAVRKNIKLAQAAAATKAALRTHCPNGHRYEVAQVGKGKYRCRACKRASMARANVSGNLTQGVVRRVFEAARAGKTLNEIDGWKGGQYIGRIVKYRKLIAFMRENPKIGARLQKLFDANRIAARATTALQRRVIAAPALLRNDGADAFAAIQAATRELFEPMRGAIQSDLWLAVAEGRLKLAEIPGAVRAAVTAHNRAEKHLVMSRWGNRSLDAPMGDDGFSLLDTLPDQGAWSPVALNTGRHVSTRNWQ